MKNSDKVIRDRLLVENYIKRKMMGHTEIVKKLSISFQLNQTYIYKILKRHRVNNPQVWEETHLESNPINADRLIVSNAVTQPIKVSGWWKRLLNKILP